MSDQFDSKFDRSSTIFSTNTQSLATKPSSTVSNFASMFIASFDFSLLRQIQKSSEILRIRLETEKMQLMSFRWKNFQILRTTETINEREVIFQELTIVKSLTIRFSLHTNRTFRMKMFWHFLIQQRRCSARK